LREISTVWKDMLFSPWRGSSRLTDHEKRVLTRKKPKRLSNGKQ